MSFGFLWPCWFWLSIFVNNFLIPNRYLQSTSHISQLTLCYSGNIHFPTPLPLCKVGLKSPPPLACVASIPIWMTFPHFGCAKIGVRALVCPKCWNGCDAGRTPFPHPPKIISSLSKLLLSLNILGFYTLHLHRMSNVIPWVGMDIFWTAQYQCTWINLSLIRNYL